MLPSPLDPRNPAAAVISGWVVLALPVGLALLMVIVTPGYFRPLWESVTGWVFIALFAIFQALGFLVTRWGVNRFGGRPPAHRLFTLAVMVLIVFPSLWLVLLGPAIMIIVRHSS